MKPDRAFCGVLVTVLLVIQNVSSTFLAGSMLTGFLGGFLMGKITLGTFLTVLSQAGRPQTTGTATSPTKVSTRGTYGLSDIPDSVDSQVRDNFLHQLGKMDPLNCLPKVFCEISSDPEAANKLFGSLNGTFNGKTKVRPSKKDGDKQDDIEGEEDSDSESDENDQDYANNDEENHFKQYQEKQEANLEATALDELLQEFDDPINYYFILKDKQKTVHPELYGLIKNSESRSLVSDSKPDTLMKRMGEAVDSSIETDTTAKAKTRPSRRGSSPVDDIFSDDPFFDDFARSLKFDETNERLAKVAQLRRSKREIIDERDIMIQYRMASTVAEKYKNPTKCRKVFASCPFTSEEVMKMANEMNPQPNGKKPYLLNKKKKEETMENMKNTLLAIEKLNAATMIAKSNGAPSGSIDYGKVMEEALKSNVASSSATSTKIMEDFEGITDKIELENSKPNKKSKITKKSKTQLIKRSHKKPSIRRRRHGEMPKQIEDYEHQIIKSRVPRISLSGSTRSRKSDSTPAVTLTSSVVAKAIESEENPDASVEPKVHNLRDAVVSNPSITILDLVKDVESRIYKSDEGEEDDEQTSVESEEPFKVPTFSQTYVETLQSPSKVKSRPRPVYPLVKIKQYVRRTTTSAPGITSTTVNSRRPVAPLTQKFSEELEDDEEEAKNSEDAIDVIISKYKPKDKKTKS